MEGVAGCSGMGSGGGGDNSSTRVLSNEECGIRDVWCYNLHDEFKAIRNVVERYKYVAMDTEFPGIVLHPTIRVFRNFMDYNYQVMRCNVDLLRIIQLGLTFFDENGKTPPGYSTWQFNFKFDLSEDKYAKVSINLLINSGIQFDRHKQYGIDPFEFAALLMSSGVVLMDDIHWLSFHSGYDFGYLLKVLTNSNLPDSVEGFFELMQLYFPVVYDVKYIMLSCQHLKGGLSRVTQQLRLPRIGCQHQAGSDAIMTGKAYFKIRQLFFDGNINDEYKGQLYLMGNTFQAN